MNIDFQKVSSDPREFRKALLIDTALGPKPMASVIDKWQAEDLAALDNGWRQAIGALLDPTARIYSCAYLERARGHSKTADTGAMAVYALYSARRKVEGDVVGSDVEQASEIFKAIDRLKRLNPWLKHIEVQKECVVNQQTGSILTQTSSDAASSFGQIQDFIILDEISNWRKRDLWDAIISTTGKKSTCMTICLSNCGTGMGVSWQWKVREIMRTDPECYFRSLNGSVASWITGAVLGSQRRKLTPKSYRRLWLNEWTVDVGDAIDESDLKAAIVPDCDLQFDPAAGHILFGSLDLGVKADRSALVLFDLCLKGERPRVVAVRSWNPKDYGGRVPLHLVSKTCREFRDRYQLNTICYDPYQGEFLADSLTADGFSMWRYPWTTASKGEMALALVQAFRDREIEIIDHPELLRDLRKISVLERNGRWTIQLPHDEDGHCDIGAAFCQGLVWALGTRRDFLGQQQPEHDRVFSSQPV